MSFPDEESHKGPMPSAEELRTNRIVNAISDQTATLCFLISFCFAVLIAFLVFER